MFAHEKIACGFKAPLHFQTCNALPVLVGEFSLAIDNCMPHLDARFEAYGQCDGAVQQLMCHKFYVIDVFCYLCHLLSLDCCIVVVLLLLWR